VKGNVLVSSGTELVFFLVADVVLCCGLRMRILLLTHWCFSCGWAVLHRANISASFAALPAEGAGAASGAGRGKNWDSWPELANGIFHTTWLFSAIKLGSAGWRGYCSSWTAWALVSWHCVLLDFYSFLCCYVLFVCFYCIEMSLSQLCHWETWSVGMVGTAWQLD